MKFFPAALPDLWSGEERKKGTMVFVSASCMNVMEAITANGKKERESREARGKRSSMPLFD